MVRCVVGADVPAARVAVCVLGGVPWARRAEDVAPYQVRACQVRAWRACAARGVRVRRAPCVCGHGAVRGRGRRPRRPAWPWAFPMASRGRSRWRSVGNGAPRTSRPTMCSAWCGACVVGADVPAARVAVFGMVRCVVGADVLGGPRVRVRHGAVRGRGRRPGGPRGRGRPRRRPLGAARVPPVYRFQKKRTKMLHEGRFGLAPSTVL